MGSSSTRKTNDRVRINLPKNISSNLAESTGVRQSVAPVDSNTLCPVSFYIKLRQQDIQPGLTIELDGNILSLQNGIEVGKMPEKTIKQIERCHGMGINYSIKSVIDKKGMRYAEFSQS